jgi:hypothetical protein
LGEPEAQAPARRPTRAIAAEARFIDPPLDSFAGAGLQSFSVCLDLGNRVPGQSRNEVLLADPLALGNLNKARAFTELGTDFLGAQAQYLGEHVNLSTEQGSS